MHSSQKIDGAVERFRRAAAQNRFPHAIVVAGSPRTSGRILVNRLLSLVYPDVPPDALHRHTDIRWVEPSSKSRRITVDDARAIVEFFSLTSYEGGWKATVFLFADRMNVEAQNVLLKTLEEPPSRSLILLVTDSPAALLATIRSRAQFADVQEPGDFASAPWYANLVSLLANPPSRHVCEVFSWADRMNAPLAEFESQALEVIQEELDDSESKADKDTREARIASRVREMSDSLIAAIHAWQRDVLAAVVTSDVPPVYFPAFANDIQCQAASLSISAALARIAAIDEFRSCLERNIRPAMALPLLARALAI